MYDFDKSLFIDITFHLSGFTAKGYHLMQGGWEVSCSRMHNYYDTYQFYLRHENACLYGFGEGSFKSIRNQGDNPFREMHVHCTMTHGTNRVEVRGTDPMIAMFGRSADIASAFAVDLGARKVTTVEDIYKGIPFAKVQVSENFEIYLNKKDEAEILDLLISKQDLKQKEIRQNERRRAFNEPGRELSEFKNEEAKALVRIV